MIQTRLTSLSLICLVRIPYCDNILIILTDTLGLIQNADDNLIQTVKDLVKHYVAKKKTLVVIAMPMTGWFLRLTFVGFTQTDLFTDDYENMQAVRLARDDGADPNGNRTIGKVFHTKK